MRKLHELLPIARQHLVTSRTRGFWSPGDSPNSPYVCNAAYRAAKFHAMTDTEAGALAHAVLSEIKEQARGRCDMLCELLSARHGASWHPNSSDYFPHRDLWLDEFQRKLERTKQ